jgi:two-component system, cell cycle response regulator
VPRLKQLASPSGHTILVVDDDQSLLQTLQRLLVSEGHSVLLAANGIEALDILRTGAVQVMLLDYSMPQMNGAEVVAELRQFNKEVQVVLQTGYASEHPARTLLRELDIQGYHDKSEGPEKLLIWVDIALKAYRQALMVKTSRAGLAYILRATPELHRFQPLEDLMRGVLLQIQGLLGLSGVLVAIPEARQRANSANHHTDTDIRSDTLTDASAMQLFPSDSFVATLAHGSATPGQARPGQAEIDFEVRIATGRFSSHSWQSLSEAERRVVQEAVRLRQPQQQGLLALPLIAGERVVGVIAIEDHSQTTNQPGNQPSNQGLGHLDLDLMELFANQAAVAIENARLYELATTDDLTRLATRRHWQNRLDDILRLATRYGKAVAVLMLDVDHFKTINDQHGHLAGDQVLAQVGQALQAGVRKSDVVGRYGGEEFVVACPFTDLAGAQVVAENLRKSIAGLALIFKSNSSQVAAPHISVSIGVAVLEVPEQVNGVEALLDGVRVSLLHAADQAMYQAKQQGRNQVVLGRVLHLSEVAANQPSTPPIPPLASDPLPDLK